MSGDHNQNQSDSGWRKRQIALDIKAKNARELGLDYEIHSCSPFCTRPMCVAVREAVADEREACAKLANDFKAFHGDVIAKAIRARGQA
tara:strand:- start:169 stop:435 length:267 start_codon:yes stop_codon:yes gene_type:complete